MQIVFWQRMFSPHMLGVAEELANRGFRVAFVATEELSPSRREQGWQVIPTKAVDRLIINDPIQAEKFIGSLGYSTVHITQGLRGNADIRTYQDQIVAAGQRLWVVMETVDPRGWRAPFKNAIYRWHIIQRSKQIEGILAIGAGTANWLTARGFPSQRTFPFAYFISLSQTSDPSTIIPDGRPFTFGYVGNLEPWKNPLLAIDAFVGLTTGDRRLLIVGDGSLRCAIKERAQYSPPQADIEYIGRLQMTEIPQFMSQLDCLLLPSNVDGWGVVASEAMLVGTPVIASDCCGVRAAVKAAPYGAVFPARDLAALQVEMTRIQTTGRDPDRRIALKAWAVTLEAKFGAAYLEQILFGSQQITLPEWLRRSGSAK